MKEMVMPKLGITMKEGKILHWLAAEGDRVEKGVPVVEVESDKANIEIEALVSGVLFKILRSEGETVLVSDVIAVIKEDGSLEDEKIEMTSKRKGDRIVTTPRARNTAEKLGIKLIAVTGTGREGMITEEDVLKAAKLQHISLPKATPLAKVIAEKMDISLESIKGTGVNGKIMKADVEVRGELNVKIPHMSGSDKKIIKLTAMRKAISDKMMQSVHGMAQANHRIKVNAVEMVRLRNQIISSGSKVSFNDIIIKIASKALSEFPVLNSSLTVEGILLHDHIHIGIAVAVEDGLIVPVIRNADTMSLEDISKDTRDLVIKAKSGKLKPEEYTGGTFTITNLGMFDIDEFTAIINPPEAAILAIGKIERVPAVEGENVVIIPKITLSLTYDHRIVDGVPAARFLQRIKQLMENPFLLI